MKKERNKIRLKGTSFLHLNRFLWAIQVSISQNTALAWIFFPTGILSLAKPLEKMSLNHTFNPFSL